MLIILNSTRFIVTVALQKKITTDKCWPIFYLIMTKKIFMQIRCLWNISFKARKGFMKYLANNLTQKRRFVFPNLFIWVRRKIPSRKCSIKATAIWMHSIDFLKKDVLKKRKEKIWCILAFQKFSQIKSSCTCSFCPRKSKLTMNRVSLHISHITIVTIVIQMRLINYFIFMQFNMVCTFWCSFLIVSLMSNLKNMMNESESWRIPALNWKLLIFHVYSISGVILYCGLDLENLWSQQIFGIWTQLSPQGSDRFGLKACRKTRTKSGLKPNKPVGFYSKPWDM